MTDNLIQIITPEEATQQQQDFTIAQPDMSDEEIFHRKIGVIEADIEDNCMDHGIRGILEHEHIQNMLAEYNEEDMQARAHGKFQHLTGLVYKIFNRKVHVIQPFAIKPEDFVLVELLDCHPRNEDALMWVAVDKYGRHFVVDEIYKNYNSDLDLMAFEIKKVAGQYRLEQRRADPSAWNTDQHDTSGKSLADKLREKGLTYIPASKARSTGTQLVQDALSYRAQEVEGQIKFLKPPMLYIFSTCTRTIWEFEHWQYNEWTGKAAQSRDKSEKPQDKDDHMMENLGRAFLNPIKFFPLPKKSEYTQEGQIPVLDPYRDPSNNGMMIIE